MFPRGRSRRNNSTTIDGASGAPVFADFSKVHSQDKQRCHGTRPQGESQRKEDSFTAARGDACRLFNSPILLPVPHGSGIVEEAKPVIRILERSMCNARAANGRDIKLAPAAQSAGVAKREPFEERRRPVQAPC